MMSISGMISDKENYFQVGGFVYTCKIFGGEIVAIS